MSSLVGLGVLMDFLEVRSYNVIEPSIFVVNILQHCGRICPENDTVYFPIKPSYRCDNIAQTNCRNTCH